MWEKERLGAGDVWQRPGCGGGGFIDKQQVTRGPKRERERDRENLIDNQGVYYIEWEDQGGRGCLYILYIDYVFIIYSPSNKGEGVYYIGRVKWC